MMPAASELGLLSVLGEAGQRATPYLLPNELLLRLYREMRRVRVLDERLSALQRQGAIGFHGPVLGQEAVPIAAAFAIEPDDWVFPALRESAIMLVRGFPLVDYLAQTFGSARDVQKGRQMPSHQASSRVRQVSWSSAIATQLPHAVGMAWAAQRRADRSIALAFLGDGATSHPDFHAALNLAGVLAAPVVFVCQNNAYALSVPVARQTRSDTLAIKARAYGMPGVRADGNDVLAVHRAVAEAARVARTGGGPTLIECVTYRRGAHSTSDDPTRYRDRAEEAVWSERDPLLRFRHHLGVLGLLDVELERRLEEAIEREIGDALALAQADPPPALNTLFDDVYAEPPWHLAEQRAALEVHFAEAVGNDRPPGA
jgi:pyruvate dehydrogenase E1 component alpha subunit/2-oxoisovalerate dehydrogenase E1 component alpha subunit